MLQNISTSTLSILVNYRWICGRHINTLPLSYSISSVMCGQLSVDDDVQCIREALYIKQYDFKSK